MYIVLHDLKLFWLYQWVFKIAWSQSFLVRSMSFLYFGEGVWIPIIVSVFISLIKKICADYFGVYVFLALYE